MGQGADPSGKPNGSRNTNYSLPAFFDWCVLASRAPPLPLRVARCTDCALRPPLQVLGCKQPVPQRRRAVFLECVARLALRCSHLRVLDGPHLRALDRQCRGICARLTPQHPSHADDEGEDDYFTFTDWSRSQAAGLAAFDATRRYFSINRAFAPGAAHVGAITWTGDISPQWQDLQRTPGYVLNWGLAGSPYVTCDIGGFSGQTNGLLLTRWFGVGVFMPIMRVHSTNSATPHFPFPELWGADASAAMRTLLEWRYALVPYLYSLAHETRSTGVPMARPLLLEFPGDAAVAGNTAQWTLGESLLVAPVVTPDNATSAYLPLLPGGAGVWFEWASAVTHAGGTTLSLTDVPLAAVPVYARSGAVVPLAPLVQVRPWPGWAAGRARHPRARVLVSPACPLFVRRTHVSAPARARDTHTSFSPYATPFLHSPVHGRAAWGPAHRRRLRRR